MHVFHLSVYYTKGLDYNQNNLTYVRVCVLYAHLLTYIISYIYTYVYMFWIPVTDLEAVYIQADIHIDIRSVIKYCSQHGGLPKTRFSQTARSAI